jgi:dTDP-4-dehydrorhamnose reductase
VRGKNFLRTVLRLASERDELRMVGDQIGAPTWARTIAEATTAIAVQILRKSNQVELRGVFHLTSSGETSWAGFAQAILEDYEDLLDWPAETGEFGGELKAKRVVKITTADYPTPARRPQNSVLSNAKIQSAFGINMPEWRGQLRLAMQDAIR